jgi:uncharacterized protein (DUF433 family)
METSSSYNVNDLPAAERQALEGLLGQPLSPDQRVLITAYTPGAASEQSVREEAGEDPQRIFEKADQHVFDHGVLPKEAETAVEEALRDFRPDPRTIDADGRIVGTRITIYDVLTYVGRHPSSIAATLGVSTAQVRAALYYFTENRKEVLKHYRAALARIARGNPPEVEVKLRQSRERLQERLREIERRRRGA